MFDDLRDLVEQLPWVTLAWMTFLGSAIGSFINVVVYRLPRGMSLANPPSYCPHCEHRIRWYDNLPVLGWLRLRGRCRDCHESISARYPLVEAITASGFAAQWIRDVMFSGTDVRQGSLIFLGQIMLFCILLCVSLIDWDGQSIPSSLFVFALIVAMLLLLADDAPIFERGSWTSARSWGSCLLGGLVGLLLSRVAHHVLSRDQLPKPDRAQWGIGALLGIYLGAGLSSVVIIVAIAACATFGRRIVRLRWAWVVTALTWVVILA